MTQASKRLLLVYNADGGMLNALMHAVQKQVSPSTYPCSLCALTYGLVSMRREWKRFLKGLRMEIVFHHRDDFAKAYPGHDFELSTILISENGNPPHVLVSKNELDSLDDVRELIEVVEDALENERLRGPQLRAVA